VHKVPPTNRLEWEFSTDENGRIVDPGALPDSLGRFTIDVPSSFVPPDGRVFLTVSCGRSLDVGTGNQWLTLERRATRAAIVVVRRGVRTINVDTLTLLVDYRPVP
jgi:hypothetical protein